MEFSDALNRCCREKVAVSQIETNPSEPQLTSREASLENRSARIGFECALNCATKVWSLIRQQCTTPDMPPAARYCESDENRMTVMVHFKLGFKCNRFLSSALACLKSATYPISVIARIRNILRQFMSIAYIDSDSAFIHVIPTSVNDPSRTLVDCDRLVPGSSESATEEPVK